MGILADDFDDLFCVLREVNEADFDTRSHLLNEKMAAIELLADRGVKWMTRPSLPATQEQRLEFLRSYVSFWESVRRVISQAEQCGDSKTVLMLFQIVDRADVILELLDDAPAIEPALTQAMLFSLAKENLLASVAKPAFDRERHQREIGREAVQRRWSDAKPDLDEKARSVADSFRRAMAEDPQIGPTNAARIAARKNQMSLRQAQRYLARFRSELEQNGDT